MLIKFYFVQDKPARKPSVERKPFEEIRGDSKSSEDDVGTRMEINPQSASRYYTTEENLGDVEEFELEIRAAIRKRSFS